MPIKPETTAAESARREASMWVDLVDDATAAGCTGVCERDVIPQGDPAADLERRARRWSHHLPSHGLGELCRFAAGLASVEAAAWDDTDAIVATRAFEDRRFLISDRLIHWAVPVLIDAGLDPSPVLLVGDRMGLVPTAAVGEGLQLPGHDPYGPADEPFLLAERLLTVWGGWVPTPDVEDVARHYDAAAATWRGLADRHPGTAGLWTALAVRSGMTQSLAER